MEEQHLSQIYAPFSSTHNRPFTFPPTPPSPAPQAPHCDPQWSTCLSQPLDTMFGYLPFQPSDTDPLFDTLTSDVYPKCEQKTNAVQEVIMSPNEMTVSHGTTPSPSNSDEITATNIQPKYSFHETDFNLCHKLEDSNAGMFRRHRYHVNEHEMLQQCATENTDSTSHKSSRCLPIAQKYGTTFLFKRSYLHSSDNEGSHSPEYLNATHLQTQCAQHLRGQAVTLEDQAGATKGFRSFDNVNDVILLQEDGTGTHHHMIVDDTRSTPLSQKDSSAGDLLAIAGAFDHTTSGGEGEFLHPQSSAPTCGLGEFIDSLLSIFNSARTLLINIFFFRSFIYIDIHRYTPIYIDTHRYTSIYAHNKIVRNLIHKHEPSYKFQL